MRKVAKISIVVLSIILIGLVLNKITITNTNENITIMNVIKQEILKSQNEEDGYKISGNVYLYETDEIVSNIEIQLYKKNNEEYEKIDITYTDSKGSYTFKGLDTGNYKVSIEDNDEYKIYEEKEIQIVNSDEVVDIQIVEKEIFQVEIKKYIKQVILNVNGTQTNYIYDSKNQVNISIKNLQNLSGIIIYEFKITNDKTKEGYAKVIKDNLPDGLSFNKDENEGWKEKNGVLYNNTLSKEKINPGETKTITLKLNINDTTKAENYLNKVSITGEVYYTAKYYDGDNLLYEEEILEGDTLAEKEESKDGYTFIGWYLDKDLTNKYDFNDVVTEDVILYAGYSKKYNVNYIVNNDTYYTDVVEDGKTTSRPENDPVVEGYAFIGWYKDSEYNEEYNFDTKITEDTNIYGKLEENEKYYVVTYMLDNELYDKDTLKQGSLIEDKVVDTKENEETTGRVITYNFSGWYKDSEYSELFNFSVGITENITVYGKYIETEVCKTKDTVSIPTEEEIKENIPTIEEIIENVENSYVEVNEDIVETSGNYVYTKNFVAQLSGDTYVITSYTGDSYDEIIIPDKIDGIDVTSITGLLNGISIGKLKVSKTLKTISDSFSSATIDEIDFSDAINITEISSSFQSITTNDLDLGNMVNLTVLDDAFNSLTADIVHFSNVLSLVSINSGSAFASAQLGSMYLDNAVSLNSVEFIRIISSITGTFDFGNAISITTIPSGFLSSKKLEKVNLNNAIGITSIQSGAFSGNDITYFSLGNAINLTTINSSAFLGYKTSDGGILNFDFGNAINLTTIDSSAFASSLNVDVLDMSKLFSLTDLDGKEFISNIKIRKVIFGTGIVNITSQAFLYNNIEELDFGCAVNLKTITDMAFSSNILKSVILEDLPSLTTVDISSFGLNYNIEIFELKNLPSLNSLYNSNPGLYGYTNSSIEFLDESEFIIDNTALEDLSGILFYYPYFTKFVVQNNKYLKNIGGSSYSNALIYGSTDHYTETDLGLKELVIKNNENLETINAVVYLGQLNMLTIEDLPNLTSIGDDAFYGSTGFIDEIVLRDLPSLTTIGSDSFYYAYNRLSQINSIILSNLPSLTTIGYEAFYTMGAETLILDNLPSLITIDDFAFAGHRAESIVLNSENVPSLTTLGAESFWPYHTGNGDSNLKSIEITDLEYLEADSTNKSLFLFIGNMKQAHNLYIENVTFKNLPKVEEIFNAISGTPVFYGITNLYIENLENLSSIYGFDLAINKSEDVQTLELIDLPSLTTISDRFYNANYLETLDLTKAGNIQSIGYQSFSYNENLKIVKLPDTLTSIDSYAFWNDPIECIEFQGDSAIFNNVLWFTLNDLSPSTCTISQTAYTQTSLLASILNIGSTNSSNSTYSLVLYKLDNGELIDNNSQYKLTYLNNSDYIDVGLEEDIENVGRYSISSTSNDYATSINSKIYLTNVSAGVYKLIDVNNSNNTLTFVVEEDGTLTGYVKINNSNNDNNIISTAEAELILSIQTGGSKPLYILLASLVLVIISLLIIINKKRKTI